MFSGARCLFLPSLISCDGTYRSDQGPTCGSFCTSALQICDGQDQRAGRRAGTTSTRTISAHCPVIKCGPVNISASVQSDAGSSILEKDLVRVKGRGAGSISCVWQWGEESCAHKFCYLLSEASPSTFHCSLCSVFLGQ